MPNPATPQTHFLAELGSIASSTILSHRVLELRQPPSYRCLARALFHPPHLDEHEGGLKIRASDKHLAHSAQLAPGGLNPRWQQAGPYHQTAHHQIQGGRQNHPVLGMIRAHRKGPGQSSYVLSESYHATHQPRHQSVRRASRVHAVRQIEVQ